MKDSTIGTPARYTPGQKVLLSAGAHRHRPGIVAEVRSEQRGVPEKYLISYRFYLPPQRSSDRKIPTIICLRSQMLLVLDEELSLDEFLRMTPPEVQSRYFSNM